LGAVSRGEAESDRRRKGGFEQVIYLPVRRTRQIPYQEIGLVLGLLACAFLLIATFRLGYGVYAGVAAALFPAVLLGLRWPTATAVTFIAFTPINRFVIMIVYHYSHSAPLTKGLELWKEAILGAILARVLYDLLFRPDRKHKVFAMDILVVFFILISVVYLAYPGPFDQQLFSLLQGFRADTVFMLAYFAGRGLHVNRKRLRWIMAAIIPGSILVGVVAVFQFVEPTLANRFFEYLGYSDFVQFQGNIGDPIAVRNRDLPGAETLPRASSLILGDLALSFYQVLTVSLAAAMFYSARRLRSVVLNGLFLVLMFVTLVMTLSRSAIASCAGAIMVAAVMARSTLRLAVVGVLGVCVVALILVTGYIKITTVEALVNFSDPSSVVHGNQLSKSIAIIATHPFGQGLATAGSIGQQLAGKDAITNESWYLQIGTEMGILAMVVYLILVAGAMLIALRQFFKVQDYWLRTLTLTVAMTAGAMLVLGNFLHSWENTPLSIVFWLLAGIAVRASSLEKAPEFSEEL
jgi:hypothetical protein